jgi:HK97 gp10 family phage protein
VPVSVKLDMGPLLKLKAEMRPKAGKIVARTAFLVEGKAKMLAPVDTGALRNSIHAAQSGELTWTVSDGVAYGVFQEFGTSRMAAHPFMTPAIEGQRAAFTDAMKELFE